MLLPADEAPKALTAEPISGDRFSLSLMFKRSPPSCSIPPMTKALRIISDSEPILPPLDEGGEPTWKVLSTIPPIHFTDIVIEGEQKNIKPGYLNLS